jgi:hypothetical protein
MVRVVASQRCGLSGASAQSQYHRPRCATRSHDLDHARLRSDLSYRVRTGNLRPALAHPHDPPSVDRDRDGGASSCKAGGITPPHLWAFEAKQCRSPTEIRMRATFAVSDRLPVYILPWKYLPRSLYAVPRHRAGHRDRRTAIPVHITQTAVPLDLQQNALAPGVVLAVLVSVVRAVGVWPAAVPGAACDAVRAQCLVGSY